MNSFFSDMFNNVLWNVLSAFIIFCISQLWYFNTKKPLEFYFKFTKDNESEDDNVPPEHINNKDTNYFKIGSTPGAIQVIDIFKKEHKVGIGWRELGDLSKYIDKSDSFIRQMIKDKIGELGKTNKYYDGLTDGYVNQIAGYFVKLLSIKKGDIIVIPANGKLNIFQATFGYQYSDGFAKNLAPHTINVEDIRLDIDVSFFNVTPRFKRAVQNRLTIISLNQYSEQIHTLIK